MQLLGLAGMLCCMAALAGTSAPKPANIRDLMNVTQFDQAGLNKLSPDEINALNAWLNQYLDSRSVRAPAPVPKAAVTPHVSTRSVPQTAGFPTAAAASGIASFGAETMTPKESPQEPNRIESRIAGPFTGWTGDTVFKLENGQVWKQAATGYYTNVELDHPQVVIKKLSFGYLLALPGHGETVFVRRIK
ncbi:MAG TPA: hypothetical protein VNI53_05040 [Gammaproteobacteria bacterium]|nr:hypothetical protein [Gammaproteobacteria bacterium]